MFSIPFAARFHYIPYDYQRLTPSGIELLLTNAGYSNIEILPRSTDVTVAAYKVLSIGYRWIVDKNIIKKIGFFLLLPLWGIAALIGQTSLWLKIGSQEDCLGYTVKAMKI